MAKPAEILKPSQTAQDAAAVLAIIIRNAMEDFHVQHLTDEQMRELNPIIRNAIYTGLQALTHYDISEGSRSFIDHHRRQIPGYWESPEFLAAYVNVVRRRDGVAAYEPGTV
jgi:hypothetical protein